MSIFVENNPKSKAGKWWKGGNPGVKSEIQNQLQKRHSWPSSSGDRCGGLRSLRRKA